MGLNLKQEDPSDISNITTGRDYLFFDVNDGLLKKKDENGVISIVEAGAVSVSSVFGRSGAVTAQTGDYTAAQITNFDTAADARITAQKGAANGLCPLDGTGKVASSYLPDITITDTFVVASQAAQEALPAQVGDVAIRTDESKSYILKTSPASLFSNWQELLTPADSVTSVNGEVGVVVLDAADVGAAPSSHVGAGDTAHALAVAGGAAGFMSGADKDKLDDIEYGATAGITQLTGDVAATGPGVVGVTLSNTVINGKLLTGFVGSLGVPAASDSILGGFNKIALTQTLAPKTISQSVTVPTGYVWTRPSMILTGDLTLAGDAELQLI
jgi:hypothetical protein